MKVLKDRPDREEWVQDRCCDRHYPWSRDSHCSHIFSLVATSSSLGTSEYSTLRLTLHALFTDEAGADKKIEKPYANFSDLHSRPQSTLTSSSFYSLGTDVMLARPTLPVPVMLSPWNGTGREKGGSRRSSLTSFGLPYESREELRVGDDEGESAYGGIRRR
jgi:hypothetical protein